MSKSRSDDSPSESRRGPGDRPLGDAVTLHLSKYSLEQTDEFVFWVDREGLLLYGNASMCRALGYSLSELQRLYFWDVSGRTPKSWPSRWEEMKQHLSATVLADLLTTSGEIVPVHVHVRHVTVEDREYFLCTGRDLRDRGAPPSESSIDAILLIHNGQVFGSHAKFKRDLEALLRDSGTTRQRLDRALTGENVTFNWFNQSPDGSQENIQCTLSRIEVDGQIRLLAIVVDITARRKSERALADLSGRLLHWQDQARRRIARDLHDNTGQHLAAMQMQLSKILASAPALSDDLRESIALADAAISQIRATSYLLHPPLLDDLGLEAAIEAYTKGFSARTGIHLDLDLPDPMRRMPQDVELAFFRIVQEGLTNIIRHSHSRTAVIRITQSQESAQLEVIDHGSGIPSDGLTRPGVGIAGMRERARQLGGKLFLASGETGTTLRVVLPV